MQKLRKLRSPCLKRTVIGLGLVAAFGAGYRFNEAKWQQLTRRQIKENPQNLTQKPFRMDEYTPEGVKTADLAAIDALPFKNPDSAKFAAYRLDSLTADTVRAAGERWLAQRQNKAKLPGFRQIECRKNELAAGQDTVYSEAFLKTNREYYGWLCLEIYKCSRYGENGDLWRKSDDELRREVLFKSSLIKTKMGVLKKMQRRSAYPTKEFEKDFRRLRMAESLRQARLLREETNRAAAYLMTAREGERRAAFEKHKDSLRTALYAGVEARRRAAADSMMYPFKHMKPGFGRQD